MKNTPFLLFSIVVLILFFTCSNSEYDDVNFFSATPTAPNTRTTSTIIPNVYKKNLST